MLHVLNNGHIAPFLAIIRVLARAGRRNPCTCSEKRPIDSQSSSLSSESDQESCADFFITESLVSSAVLIRRNNVSRGKVAGKL